MILINLWKKLSQLLTKIKDNPEKISDLLNFYLKVPAKRDLAVSIKHPSDDPMTSIAIIQTLGCSTRSGLVYDELSFNKDCSKFCVKNFDESGFVTVEEFLEVIGIDIENYEYEYKFIE